MSTFTDDVHKVLEEKGYAKHCATLDVLAKAVDINNKYVAHKVWFYKWSGLFLLTFIPIVSALLSVLVSLKGQHHWWLSESIVLPLSLALTVFTILNSIFKPSERFSEACLIGVGIELFTVEFFMDLEQMTQIDEPALVELIGKKCKEFQVFEIKQIGIFMPANPPKE